MDDINQQFLGPLWGYTIVDYKIDLRYNSIHFKLYAGDNGGIWHQVDIYNVRMFSFATDDCYGDRAERSGFPESFREWEDIPDRCFAEGYADFLKEFAYSGTNLMLEEIQAAEPGEANVKVYFKFNCARQEVSSPYYNADQNVVIDFTASALTISAEKVVVDGHWFLWNREKGAFLPIEPPQDRVPTWHH